MPLKEVKKEMVVNFIRTHLIYRYGVSRYIITDNGKPFYNRLMTELCKKFGFKQYNSSMYNASANGLVEAFNKTLGSLLKKVVSKTKRDWHERIEEALWGILNNISNAYSSDTIFSCLWGGSHPSFRKPNPIITDCHSRRID